MPDIIIRNISKAFAENDVLKAFSAVIPAGEISCLMAPSGRGKTTLLRILMGLEQPDSGHISGVTGFRLSAVFQEDRLCENLSPVTNIRLVCRSHSTRAVIDALNAAGLSGCIGQPVRELSGGMRRRVALLRALMADYDILFLDEPFKGLDAAAKATVMAQTRKHIQGKTVLLVTHDPQEAQTLGAGTIITL